MVYRTAGELVFIGEVPSARIKKEQLKHVWTVIFETKGQDLPDEVWLGQVALRH